VPESFDRLQGSVSEEYQDRGYSKERADKIGYVVAGKQANLKHARLKKKGKKHVMVMPKQVDYPVGRRKKVVHDG
jgi:hypothetical protein